VVVLVLQSMGPLNSLGGLAQLIALTWLPVSLAISMLRHRLGCRAAADAALVYGVLTVAVVECGGDRAGWGRWSTQGSLLPGCWPPGWRRCSSVRCASGRSGVNRLIYGSATTRP
jgi:hypothetical protein